MPRQYKWRHYTDKTAGIDDYLAFEAWSENMMRQVFDNVAAEAGRRLFVNKQENTVIGDFIRNLSDTQWNGDPFRSKDLAGYGQWKVTQAGVQPSGLAKRPIKLTVSVQARKGRHTGTKDLSWNMANHTDFEPPVELKASIATMGADPKWAFTSCQGGESDTQSDSGETRMQIEDAATTTCEQLTVNPSADEWKPVCNSLTNHIYYEYGDTLQHGTGIPNDEMETIEQTLCDRCQTALERIWPAPASLPSEDDLKWGKPTGWIKKTDPDTHKAYLRNDSLCKVYEMGEQIGSLRLFMEVWEGGRDGSRFKDGGLSAVSSGPSAEEHHSHALDQGSASQPRRSFWDCVLASPVAGSIEG